jgi:asparagine synthase (glutamine-hydrolysing)
MCGIAGFLELDGARPDPVVLTAMTDTLVHRGPDGAGHVVLGPTALGHRRLAIIDLAGSPQPMTSADGRFTIVFNGEILNYAELRRRHHLPSRTNGDTEVLLELLARHGTAALVELRGQFAFACHDAADGSVLLARDRMGILPLFHTTRHGRFAFASELKALWPAVGSGTLDRSALADFLLQRAVPAPFTIYDGVRKLEPGTWMRVHPDGRTATGRYWSSTEERPTLRLSPDEAVDELERLLTDALSDALVADVPVGAYLSGGVDSTVTVALAARAAKATRLATFAAGFPVAADDERSYARRVAQRLGTEHHEVVVQPDDFLADLRRLVRFRDVPVSETSDIAVAALARLAADHVKVVISGEGSDELFAGYPKYRLARALHLAGHVPAAVRSPIADLARRAARGRNDRLDTALRVAAGRTEWDRLRAWFAPFTPDEVRRLCGDEGRSAEAFLTLTGDPVARLGRLDCASWLADNLLERGDRMTMASSIELRPPFLDPRVVEFALALPSAVKLHHGVPKWPVRQLAKRFVDADIIDRPKVGFRVPIGEWFRTGLRDPLRDSLLGADAVTADWLDRTMVTRLVDDHVHGRVDHAKQLWPLFSLEIWGREVLRASTPA